MAQPLSLLVEVGVDDGKKLVVAQALSRYPPLIPGVRPRRQHAGMQERSSVAEGRPHPWPERPAAEEYPAGFNGVCAKGAAHHVVAPHLARAVELQCPKRQGPAHPSPRGNP